MLIHVKNYYHGDTLIEALFAITVFSLVAVGGLTVMNQGANISQRALEITLVRQEMDAQAETLRFLNSSYIAAYQSGATSYTGPAQQWLLLRDSVVASASSFGTGEACALPQSGSFVLDTHNAKFVDPTGKLSLATTFSQVKYKYNPMARTYTFNLAEGIWIEAVRSNASADPTQSNTGYIDFNIRTCWYTPGQSTPMTLGTIVRLYEPR